jgi:NAD/NADP transhydrogenase alpha subunit
MAPSTSRQPLWLRAEKKTFERRSALTPTTARKLIDAGFDITVERDEQRIFDDEEFEKWVELMAITAICARFFHTDTPVRRAARTHFPSYLSQSWMQARRQLVMAERTR